jgi:hypothetical protein
MRVKSVSDLKVASIAGVLVLIQVMMCAVLSGTKMTWPDYLSNGSNEVVRGCNTGNGFNTWVGVNIAVFGLCMIAGAFIAFKTRNVPSAFNESHHILYSLVLLLFFLLMLVPLDFLLVNNSPEASVLIQAAGQLLLSFFLLVFNFAPKVYYLYTGLGSDKSITQTMGSQGSSLRSNMPSSSPNTQNRSNKVQPKSQIDASPNTTSNNRSLIGTPASPKNQRKLEMQVLQPPKEDGPEFKAPSEVAADPNVPLNGAKPEGTS